jgi:hypothetical protein
VHLQGGCDVLIQGKVESTGVLELKGSLLKIN